MLSHINNTRNAYLMLHRILVISAITSTYGRLTPLIEYGQNATDGPSPSHPWGDPLSD